MLAKRIMPCLDVDRARVVKGIRFVSLVDAGDPVEQAKRYASLEDLERLRAVSHCSVDSVIVGKALYEGRLTLPDAIAICS